MDILAKLKISVCWHWSSKLFIWKYEMSIIQNLVLRFLLYHVKRTSAFLTYPAPQGLKLCKRTVSCHLGVWSPVWSLRTREYPATPARTVLYAPNAPLLWEPMISCGAPPHSRRSHSVQEGPVLDPWKTGLWSVTLKVCHQCEISELWRLHYAYIRERLYSFWFLIDTCHL